MPYADPEKRREYDRSEKRLASHRKTSSKYYHDHRDICLDKMKKRVRNLTFKQKEERKLYMKDYWLKSEFGLSLEDFNRIKESQGGKCAICRRREATCVDHCHASGKVRELLCKRCNSVLGELEVPGWLNDAKRYLEKHASGL